MKPLTVLGRCCALPPSRLLQMCGFSGLLANWCQLTRDWKWKRLVLVRVQVGVKLGDGLPPAVMVGLQCREPGSPDSLASPAPETPVAVAVAKAPKYYVVDDDDSDDDVHGACKPRSRVPCKHGRGCYRQDNRGHTTRFSHPPRPNARAPQNAPQGPTADGTLLGPQPGSSRKHALKVDSSADECEIRAESTPKHNGHSKDQPVVVVVVASSSDESSSIMISSDRSSDSDDEDEITSAPPPACTCSTAVVVASPTISDSATVVAPAVGALAPTTNGVSADVILVRDAAPVIDDDDDGATAACASASAHTASDDAETDATPATLPTVLRSGVGVDSSVGKSAGALGSAPGIPSPSTAGTPRVDTDTNVADATPSPGMFRWLTEAEYNRVAMQLQDREGVVPLWLVRCIQPSVRVGLPADTN